MKAAVTHSGNIQMDGHDMLVHSTANQQKTKHAHQHKPVNNECNLFTILLLYLETQ